MTQENQEQDTHGTPRITRWVHKHRTLAKWIARGFVLGATSISYYLKRQEKKIVEEERSKKQ